MYNFIIIHAIQENMAALQENMAVLQDSGPRTFVLVTVHRRTDGGALRHSPVPHRPAQLSIFLEFLKLFALLFSREAFC